MQNDHLTLTCEKASALVPVYLDGELSEAQAAPLRSHLLQCVACREGAKSGKALKRWFVAAAAPAIPQGFAARVARRAFAGDPGLTSQAEGDAERGRAPEGEGALFQFTLRLTAIAAGLLFFLALGLQLRARPAAGDELQAEDLNVVWEEIDGLADAAPPQAPAAPEVDASKPGEDASAPAQR